MKYKEGVENILIFNCGSSSLKYKLIEMPSEMELISGEAENIGMKAHGPSFITHSAPGEKKRVDMELANHEAAFNKIIDLIKENSLRNKDIYFSAFGHRYVHPGNMFSKTTKVDKVVLRKLKSTLPLAPIHNPVSYNIIELCAKMFPKVPQYVVFDASFHSTIPRELSTYAIPLKFTKKYGIKKVGFHGTSHKYVMEESCGFLKRDVKTQKIISCHLGAGGASVCAINYGKSINNSMGFTPMEGLIMNTRSGDVELGLIFYIMFRENFSVDDIEKILNRESGILGVFDASSDLRDVVSCVGTQPKADMIFKMYVRRIKKYIGFYELLLKKADILIFTDSIGVSSPLLREKVCSGLGIFGIKLDTGKNNSYSGGIKDISDPAGETRILVMPTDEERMIAREAFKVMKHDTDN
jgi:acetate kinase